MADHQKMLFERLSQSSKLVSRQPLLNHNLLNGMLAIKVRLEAVKQQDHILRLVLKNLVEPLSLGESGSVGLKQDGVIDAVIFGKMDPMP